MLPVVQVFEYVERTVLDELEKNPRGLGMDAVKQLLWQLLRAVAFCHAHNVVHRDIKPENLLISRHGVLKVCDFGFARTIADKDARYTGQPTLQPPAHIPSLASPRLRN